MEADATLPLQRAIVAALKADSGIVSLVSDRVYDAVPANTAKPYISVGPMDSVPFTAAGSPPDEIYEASDTTIQLDGWSGALGSVEVKRIGRAVRAVLHYRDLTLDDNQRLVLLQVEQVQYLVDPDGLTHHAVVILRARTEPLEGSYSLELREDGGLELRE